MIRLWVMVVRQRPELIYEEAFIACVQGNPAPHVTGKDAKAALQLTMGLLESATTGQVKNMDL